MNGGTQGELLQYLNGVKLRLSDLHNDDSRCRTAGQCSLKSYPGQDMTSL